MYSSEKKADGQIELKGFRLVEKPDQGQRLFELTGQAVASSKFETDVANGKLPGEAIELYARTFARFVRAVERWSLFLIKHPRLAKRIYAQKQPAQALVDSPLLREDPWAGAILRAELRAEQELEFVEDALERGSRAEILRLHRELSERYGT